MRLTDIIETGGQDWYRYGEAPPLCPLLAGCAEICEDALAVETAGVLGSVVEGSRRVASFWIVQRLLYVFFFFVQACSLFCVVRMISTSVLSVLVMILAVSLVLSDLYPCYMATYSCASELVILRSSHFTLIVSPPDDPGESVIRMQV